MLGVGALALGGGIGLSACVGGRWKFGDESGEGCRELEEVEALLSQALILRLILRTSKESGSSESV